MIELSIYLHNVYRVRDDLFFIRNGNFFKKDQYPKE